MKVVEVERAGVREVKVELGPGREMVGGSCLVVVLNEDVTLRVLREDLGGGHEVSYDGGRDAVEAVDMVPALRSNDEEVDVVGAGEGPRSVAQLRYLELIVETIGISWTGGMGPHTGQSRDGRNDFEPYFVELLIHIGLQCLIVDDSLDLSVINEFELHGLRRRLRDSRQRELEVVADVESRDELEGEDEGSEGTDEIRCYSRRVPQFEERVIAAAVNETLGKGSFRDDLNSRAVAKCLLRHHLYLPVIVAAQVCLVHNVHRHGRAEIDSLEVGDGDLGRVVDGVLRTGFDLADDLLTCARHDAAVRFAGDKSVGLTEVEGPAWPPDEGVSSVVEQHYLAYGRLLERVSNADVSVITCRDVPSIGELEYHTRDASRLSHSGIEGVPGEGIRQRGGAQIGILLLFDAAERGGDEGLELVGACHGREFDALLAALRADCRISDVTAGRGQTLLWAGLNENLSIGGDFT